MKRILALWFLTAAIVPAAAQWNTLPQYSIPVGRGPGVSTPGAVTPGVIGRPIVSQGVSANPIFSSVLSNLTSITTTDQVFAPARPWCDVRARGALGNTVANDSAAFQACADELVALYGGGIILVPPSNGFYCITTTVTLSGAIKIMGSVPHTSSILSSCAADVTVISMDSFSAQLENLAVFGKGSGGITATFGATVPTIDMTPNCVQCQLTFVKATGGSNAIRVRAADVRLNNVIASISYGSAVLKLEGNPNGSSGTAGIRIVGGSFDQGWPYSLPVGPITISAWANAHVYVAGDVVSTGGYVIQCMVGGTSAGVAPTLQNYGITITDGATVRWQLVGPSTYYGVQVDSGASEIMISQTDLTGSYTAPLAITNTGVGVVPSYISLTDSIVSQGRTAGVLALAGSALYLNGNHILGCVTTGCSPVTIGALFTARAIIDHNLIRDGQTYGISILGGTENLVNANSLGNNPTAHIYVAPNITKFNITGNTLIDNAIGVLIDVGTSNQYNVVGNVISSTTPISDGGTGLSKALSNNGGAVTTLISLPGGSIFSMDATYSGAFTGGTVGGILVRFSSASTNGAKLYQGSLDGDVNLYNLANNALNFGTNTLTRFSISAVGGWFASGVTGGDKGLGTANFKTGVWVDNVPVVTTATGAALTKTDDTNVTLTLGGSPTTALVNAASLTLNWTGQLSLTRGGTAASLTASNGGIVYSTASTMAILAGTATANQMLLSGASTTPAWSTSTYPATSSAGTMLASLTANTVTATAAPVLGASGTLGTLTFGNATSGLLTLRPVTGALGTVTVSIPAATDTLVNLSSAQTLTTKIIASSPGIGINQTADRTNGLVANGGASNVLFQFFNTFTGTTAGDGTYFGVLGGEAHFNIVQQENAYIQFTNSTTGATLRLHASGALSLGTTTDPGAGRFLANGYIDTNTGYYSLGTAGVNCTVGTVVAATMVVTYGIVTHC